MRLHNRQVKAAFWTDTDLLRLLDIPGRMFYQGLWQLADDSGCLEYDVLAFKIHLFPADPVDTEAIQHWIDKLIESKKLIPYEAENKKCLYLKNFHKHQTLKNCPPPAVPLPPWISFEPYPSNNKQGKYVIREDILNEFLQCSYNKKNINETGLRLSYNQNQNLNQNKDIYSTSEQSPDASQNVPESKTEKREASEKPKNRSRQIPVFDEDTEQYKLALFMRQCILENLPNAKVPEATPDKLKRWSYDIDLMMRIDCRSPDEIRELIDWSHRDQFWKANILSPGKLREKWDTLVAHKKRAEEKTRDSPNNQKHLIPQANFRQRQYSDEFYKKLIGGF